MRISDWSSDVCSSDLNIDAARRATCAHPCRERHRRRRPAGGKSMKVIVLGAGVVGVTSAWYLAEAGHEVVLVDRQRSEERRVGKESVSPCRSRGSPYH